MRLNINLMMFRFESKFNFNNDKNHKEGNLRYFHFIQDHVKSTKFCEYLCAKVLPEWDSILSDDQNMLLRILAELCEHTEKFEQPKEAVANIHTVLMVRNVGNFRFLR